jgi:phytoene desaturase
VYFGVDEFIAIADNLAEIEATEGLKKEMFCTNSNRSKSNYDIAIDLVYRPGFTIRTSNGRNNKEDRAVFSNISRDVRKKFKTND